MSVAAFVLAADAYSQNNEDRRSINVMTFNIRYDEPRDGLDAWKNRKEHVAAMIKKSDADLIGLQEALKHQLDDLLKLLPDFSYCGVGRTDGKDSGEFSAILYRRSRFKVKKCETYWLSETPNTAGSKGWDAAFPRIVSWIKAKDRSSGRTFFHFNTHFDHVGEQARRNSVDLIVSEAVKAAGRTPFFITGDLNANESSAVYQMMRTRLLSGETILFDTRYISKTPWSGPDSTFSGFKELQPHNKIDHIFVSANIEVLNAASLDQRFDGRWASDHIPVTARLTVGKRQKHK